MAATTGTSTRILKPIVSDLYDARIKNAWLQGWSQGQTKYAECYQTINITTQDIATTYLSGLPMWSIKPFGGEITYGTIYQGYATTITPASYSEGFIVEMETMQDDPHGILAGDLARSLADMGRYTVDVLAMVQFNTGFTSTVPSVWMSGGDGQYFFDTDHPILAGGTYANKPNTGCDFSIAALQAARNSLAKVQGPQGEIIGLDAELILAPVELRWTIDQILASERTPYISYTYQSSTLVGTTGPEAVNVVRQGLRAVYNEFLSSSTAWFVRAKLAPFGESGRPTGPGATTVAVWRMQPQFDRDGDFNTKDRKYSGVMRLGFGRWDWRYWYGNPGA